MSPENPFLAESRIALPRLISNLNRNVFSPTFGSFDRAWWHYRAVTGFASATFCQGMLALAVARKHPVFETGYESRPEELDRLIEAALMHWTTLQHDDGSFDEWYPFERSHVATAFTSYAVGETILLLRSELDGEVQRRAVEALHRAALWLAENLDDKVLNHTAGAIPALHFALRLTGDDALAAGINRNLDLMRRSQSEEGWFLENGSFDAGYLSLSLHYLWRYFEASDDERALTMCEKGFAFLRHLLHPDGTNGGEYAARNTRYLMPCGIVAASARLADAAAARDHLFASIARRRAITPNSTDDRYMTFFFLPNWMLAAVHPSLAKSGAREIAGGASGDSAAGDRHFPDAGLVVLDRKSSRLALNYRKAGLSRFHGRGESPEEILADNGYFLRGPDGEVYSSQYLSGRESIRELFLDDRTLEGRIELELDLRKVNYELPLRKYDIPFSIFSRTIGRLPAVNKALETSIKDIFIRKPATGPYRLLRKIEIRRETVTIRDEISGPADRAVEISRGGPDTAPHVPTSRYAPPNPTTGSVFRWKGLLPFTTSIIMRLESGSIEIDPG